MPSIFTLSASYKEPTFKCKCSTWSSTFSSQPTLNRHKLKEGHNKREIATASTPKKKRQRKTKQRKINEMLRTHQSNSNDGNSDEECLFFQNVCSSTNCQINLGNNPVINWIGCESCDLWFHFFLKNIIAFHFDGGWYPIETSQSIWISNQLSGFYMILASVMIKCV